MKLFAQIRKVDEEKRLVYGRAADETVDKANEALDYAGSKPHFMKWSEDMAKDTGGKSLGNVRAMHGKVAAGGLTGIDFDDTAKTVDVCAKIVDDQEWKKVLAGVYTGFSIGGAYGTKTVEKMDGKDVTRYVAIPSEISLVDRPCIPTAKFFEVQKADGSLQKVDFAAGGDEDAECLDVEVQGTADEVAELGKLMTEKDLPLSKVLEMVKAWPPEKKEPAEGEKKEETPEEKKAREAKEAADAEAAEKLAKAGLDAALEKAETAIVAAAELAKVGARNNSADKSRIEAIHKAAVDLGAMCAGANKGEQSAGLQKLDADTLAKVVADAVAPMQKLLDEQAAKITKLEAQPAVPRVSLRAVSKAQDVASTEQQFTEADLVKDAQGTVHPAATLIKQALAQGGQPLAYHG